ncbi:hypothetical protein ACFWBB_37860 [Streptomyces sp. NPDC060000]|uniref:hypothetical protein n=1 Tax=Streptomyces sp. NPDC060000 TaxID=3347031 RepID=UPI0036A221A4
MRATDAYVTAVACELVAAMRVLRMRPERAGSPAPPADVLAAATAVLPAGTEDRPLTGDVTAAVEPLPRPAGL